MWYGAVSRTSDVAWDSFKDSICGCGGIVRGSQDRTLAGSGWAVQEGAVRSACPTGYQRQLTYKHQDGSYSAFGERDASGSMW